MIDLLALFAGEADDRHPGPDHRHPGERRDLSPARAAELAAALADPTQFGGPVAVATVSRRAPAYSSGRLWRGPVWLNTNLLLATGLRANGFAELAAQVEASSMRLVEAGGPYEYFDAETGAPAPSAVPFFGWTAGYLRRPRRPAQRREPQRDGNLGAGSLSAGNG